MSHKFLNSPGEIRLAIRNGLSVNRLCRESGIDLQTLNRQLNGDTFSIGDLVKINRVIRDWKREQIAAGE